MPPQDDHTPRRALFAALWAELNVAVAMSALEDVAIVIAVLASLLVASLAILEPR